MALFDVFNELVLSEKLLIALVTLVWALIEMSPSVVISVATGRKCSLAILKAACVGSLTSVHSKMLLQVTFLMKYFAATFF